MAPSILVAYATRYGSTREVAERVGERLRERGVDVKVEAARDASIEGSDAVVLGAPLYIGTLLKDGMMFLERNRAALQRVPIAVFALGPVSAEEGSKDARVQLDECLHRHQWLRPATTEVFVGKYDPSRLRLADKLLTLLPASPLHGLPASDGRDWAAIQAWADGVASTLLMH